MKARFLLITLLLISACEKPIEKTKLSPSKKMGVVTITTPYFYTASVGMLRFNNEFSGFGITNWHMDKYMAQQAIQQLKACGQINVSGKDYTSPELVTTYKKVESISLLDQFIEGSGAYYNFDNVKPLLMEIIHKNNLNYLLVILEAPLGDGHYFRRARGAYGLYFHSVPLQSTPYIYASARSIIIDRSGSVIANTRRAADMIPYNIESKGDYSFSWQQDASKYKPQDIRLFQDTLKKATEILIRSHLKTLGLCDG